MCLPHFFGRDHLLGVIILGVYAKGWPKCARISGLKLMQTEALHAELNERAEAASESYSAEVDFLQYIYLMLVAKNT